MISTVVGLKFSWTPIRLVESLLPQYRPANAGGFVVVVVEVVAVVTEEVDEAAEEDATVLAKVVDCGSSVVVAVDGEVVDIAVEIDCEGTADVRTDPGGWMLVEFTDIVSLHITGNACGHDGSFG